MVWFPVYTKRRPFDSEGGGRLGNYIGTDCFQHELGQKNYFQVIRCQNTYLHPQQNFEKGGGGVRLNDLNQSVKGGGGGVGWVGIFFK